MGNPTVPFFCGLLHRGEFAKFPMGWAPDEVPHDLLGDWPTPLTNDGLKVSWENEYSQYIYILYIYIDYILYYIILYYIILYYIILYIYYIYHILYISYIILYIYNIYHILYIILYIYILYIYILYIYSIIYIHYILYYMFYIYYIWKNIKFMFQTTNQSSIQSNMSNPTYILKPHLTRSSDKIGHPINCNRLHSQHWKEMDIHWPNNSLKPHVITCWHRPVYLTKSGLLWGIRMCFSISQKRLMGFLPNHHPQ